MILIVCAVGSFFFICGTSISCYAYCQYKKSKAEMIAELEEMRKFDGISGTDVLQGEQIGQTVVYDASKFHGESVLDFYGNISQEPIAPEYAEGNIIAAKTKKGRLHQKEKKINNWPTKHQDQDGSEIRETSVGDTFSPFIAMSRKAPVNFMAI